MDSYAGSLYFSHMPAQHRSHRQPPALDCAERLITLSNKQAVTFDKALIATGANVRRLNAPGCELEGIHYLRTLGNSDTIREDAAGKRVVLVGGSYIASEVAASIRTTSTASRATIAPPAA